MLKFVLLSIIMLSAVNAEFLFDKNVAANDKFMCLHKKLYRNEKPTVKANPARILALRRLQSSEKDASIIEDFQKYLCEGNHLKASTTPRKCYKFAKFASEAGLKHLMPTEQLKKLTAKLINEEYDKLKSANEQSGTSNADPDELIFDRNKISVILNKVKAQVTHYVNLLGPSRALAWQSANIQKKRIEYIMLKIHDIFVDDKARALRAWDDYFSAYKSTVEKTTTIANAATIKWIEAIRKRYQELKHDENKDTEQILEPYFKEGTSASEKPSGFWTETVPGIKLPNPKELEEAEPKTPEVPKGRPDVPIKDLIIEIQRTYNIQKMLLAYDQLTTSMKTDIQSCKLSLKGALKRCESLHGKDACEPVSPTMVARKCPRGYIREGPSRCSPVCDNKDYNTSNRAICEIKGELHTIPALTLDKDGEIIGASCGSGFSQNQFICYRDCPKGFKMLAGASCLKTSTVKMGAPFQWTPGDE